MIRVRRAHERGHADHGWLSSHHTFSFADYYDPDQMGFRTMRVLNEDRVAPGQGFPTHGHRDMEILSYVLSGALEHKDSLGTGSVILPGDLQRMSAGTGVFHSEYNASKRDYVHFLQIWILPERRGLLPRYEQKAFPKDERTNQLRLIASRDGRDGSISLAQDADLYTALLDAGRHVELAVRPGRHVWLQVGRGTVRANGEALSAGDGLALSDERKLEIAASDPSELLVFDLP